MARAHAGTAAVSECYSTLTLFFHSFFRDFYFYVFLAHALIWQVVRTQGSLGRQYAEEHLKVFSPLYMDGFVGPKS